MLSYNLNSYEQLFGKITNETILNIASCMSQCTGCMCNCRCSCSGGFESNIDWENI